MQSNRTNKAVILFIREERNHNVKYLQSPNTYALFNQRVNEIVTGTKNEIKVDVILCSDDLTLLKSDHFIKQHGKSFHEKFNNALEDTYQLGCEEIIILGNDTPELAPEHLIETFEKLSQEKVVIGPSNDGGIYLLGLTKKSFQKKIKARWNTSKVRNDLLQFFSGKEIYLLNYLCDIDSERDLQFWLSIKSQYTLLFQKMLSAFAAVKEKEFTVSINFPTEQSLYRIYIQKAPPHLITLL